MQLFSYRLAFCLYGFIKASGKKTEKCKVLALVVSSMSLIKSVELRPRWVYQAGLKHTFSIIWALACLVIQKEWMGNSLGIQWLRLHAPSAGGTGLIPDQGTKIPHAAQRGQKKRNKGKR